MENNTYSIVNDNRNIIFQCYNKKKNENLIIYEDSYNKQFVYITTSPKRSTIFRAHSLKFLAAYYTFPEWCMPHLADAIPELYSYVNDKIIVSIDLNDMINKSCDNELFIDFKYLISSFHNNKLVKINDILEHYDIPNSSVILTEKEKSDKSLMFTDILDNSSEWVNVEGDFITSDNTIFIYRNVYVNLIISSIPS